MHILLTALSVVALLGCFLAYTRTQRDSDAAQDALRDCESSLLKLREDRTRVTVLERELDALRRELRKLSGKFYATLREWDSPDVVEESDGADGRLAAAVRPSAPVGHLPVCENWALAKQEGPTSAAAQCQCLYCATQRADRARVRAALVPKGAQATAATAKLNAGKP